MANLMPKYRFFVLASWIFAVLPQHASADLVGAWNFNEGSGAVVAADASMLLPAANGTLKSGASMVTDPTRGSVLSVNGSASGYVDCGNAAKFSMSNAVTIMAWIKPSRTDTAWLCVAGKGAGPRIFQQSNGVVFACNLGSQDWNHSNAQGGWGILTTGTWYHIAGTYDGSMLRVYINGVLIGTTATSGTIWQVADPFTIGGLGVNNSFPGCIDDVGIWNEALLVGATDGSEPGTINYYRINGIHNSLPPHYSYVSRAGDLDENGIANEADIAVFAANWLCSCSSSNQWCNGSDFDFSGKVDSKDFKIFADHWLDIDLLGPAVAVGSLYGVPTFKSDANWVARPGYSDLHPYPKYLSQFAQAGTVLFDIPITGSAWDAASALNTWTGANPDIWDYSLVDSFFDTVLAAQPNALILPRIFIGTPPWWLSDPCNQGEMEIMDDGVSQSMYYSGYAANPGILPRSGPFPSLASKKWRIEMAQGIRNLLDHIRAAGYSTHIAGYELSGLATEEWYHWSSARNELPGYSTPTRIAFRDWLRKQYNNDVNALRASWANATITFDIADVPARTERKAYENSRTFCDVNVPMNVIDFNHFYNEIVPDTIDYFANVIKNKTGRTKVVGAFYGYMYGFVGDPSFGHDALEKFCQSPNLDYFYPTHWRQGLGGSDYFSGPGYTAQLHNKIWFLSNDTATVKTKQIWDYYGVSWGWTPEQIAATLANQGYSDTIEKNRAIMRRTAGFVACNGLFQNYLDLHATDYAGYYDDPNLMAEVNSLNGFYDRTKNYDRSSSSQILIVSDEVSCYYVRSLDWWNGLLRTALYNPQLQFARMGTPADHVLVDDLSLIDANRYKMVVFLNCYNLTDHQRTLIEALKTNGRLLVFCYAPGYFNGRSFSSGNMQAVCGMNIAVSSSETFIKPAVSITASSPLGLTIANAGYANFSTNAFCCKRLWVSDAGATQLGVYPDASSYASTALKDMGTWKSVYCATADMPAGVYRELARYAGAHIYNESSDTLYANKSYVCIHPSSAGTRTVKFPQNVNIYDALTEQLLAASANSYTFSSQVGETRIFRYIPAQ